MARPGHEAELSPASFTHPPASFAHRGRSCICHSLTPACRAILHKHRLRAEILQNNTRPSGSLVVLSKLAALFSSPTPLASLVSGLLMLALLAALYTTFDWLRGRR